MLTLLAGTGARVLVADRSPAPCRGAVYRAKGGTMSGTTPFDCPRCGVVLTMSERQGIEIDYCPQCRGVWLDRGELDKIIAHSEAPGQGPSAAQPAPGSPAGGWTQPAAPPPPQQPWSGGQRGYRSDDDDDDERRGYGHGGRRRSSWLKDFFD